MRSRQLTLQAIQELSSSPTPEMVALSNEVHQLLRPYLERALDIMSKHDDHSMVLAVQSATHHATMTLRASQIYAVGCCTDHNLLNAHQFVMQNVSCDVAVMQEHILELHRINPDEENHDEKDQ